MFSAVSFRGVSDKPVLAFTVTILYRSLSDSPNFVQSSSIMEINPSFSLPMYFSDRFPAFLALLILHDTILSCSGTTMCTQTTYTYTSSDCDCEYILFICCSRAKLREGRLPSCKGGPVIKRSERIEGGCWGTDCWMQGRECVKE
jgi:hypothetical protein